MKKCRNNSNLYEYNEFYSDFYCLEGEHAELI
jgi:hypothetical protein